jgi:general secretion pathway protein E
MAQRLVRQVCAKCGVDVTLTPDEIAALQLPLRPGEKPPSLTVRRGEGCVTCRGTGLYGRLGLFEVLEITDKIRTLVNARAPAAELQKAARLDGMTTLRETAVRRLAAGDTSFEEVIRVTQADES